MSVIKAVILKLSLSIARDSTRRVPNVERSRLGRRPATSGMTVEVLPHRRPGHEVISDVVFSFFLSDIYAMLQKKERGPPDFMTATRPPPPPLHHSNRPAAHLVA